MKNMDDFHYRKEAIMWCHQTDMFCCKQRSMEHKEGHRYAHEDMYFMYCSMAKGTSWAEAMLNSKIIKSVVFAVIEFCLSGSIS